MRSLAFATRRPSPGGRLSAGAWRSRFAFLLSATWSSFCILGRSHALAQPAAALDD